MTIADELDKLQRLRESGALSEQEFVRAKEKLLDAPRGDRPFDYGERAPSTWTQPSDVEQRTRTWAMLLHLSLLAGYALPGAGFIAPVVIWVLKKDELPGLDPHGRMAINWIISLVLWTILFVLLSLVLIGIPLLIALGVVTVVFPIVGAIKANNGELWRYPATIEFLR